MKQNEINKAFEGRWRIKADNHPEAWVGGVKSLCRDFFEAGILIGEKSTVPEASPSGNPITTRAERFFSQVLSFSGQYPDTLLHDFYEYWSEPNPSHTKMRFEQQKTWDLPRRIARWARNDFNHYGTDKPTLQQQRATKLADILVG
jgi:hypothetical protein